MADPQVVSAIIYVASILSGAVATFLSIKKYLNSSAQQTRTSIENSFQVSMTSLGENLGIRIKALEEHINTKIEDIKTDVTQLRVDIKDVKNEAFHSITNAKSDLRETVRENDNKVNRRIDELVERMLRLEKNG